MVVSPLEIPAGAVAGSVQPAPTRAETAARDYIARKERATNPSGTFDSAGRWYPDEGELRPCCDGIRPPSRGWPYSLLVHCRTADHVAALHGLNRADRAEMARVVRATDPAAARAAAKRAANTAGKQQRLLQRIAGALGQDLLNLMPLARERVEATRGAAILNEWDDLDEGELLDAVARRSSDRGDSRLAVALRLLNGEDRDTPSRPDRPTRPTPTARRDRHERQRQRPR